MNVAFFLNPKQTVAYLYDDFTIRQALEKMRNCGYSAIPVISRDGKYIGTVSDGDFLWEVMDTAQYNPNNILLKELEKKPLSKIIKTDKYKPASFNMNVEELFHIAQNQNFVPVVDDTGTFSGIVTRKSIMKYLVTL